MSDFILHHYDTSPFSEKIRVLMGYKAKAYPDLIYQAVTIPVIMPKPTLMPLTGGYRKTPVAQIGADIYCDTSLIARVIDRMYPELTVFPASAEASVGAAAHWTDTFFFRVCVTMAFQPKALAGSPLFTDQEAAAAFMADRAEFSKGSTQLAMSLEDAEPHWLLHLRRLDEQLAEAEYLGGSEPNILDFSTYHCLWFTYNNEALREDFAPFNHVQRWMAQIRDFGHGGITNMEGEVALAVARDATPAEVSKQGFELSQGPALGDEVEVMAADYGFQPTTGKLVVNSLEEIAVQRHDEQVGDVVVHFPRLGFQARAAG
ncbi:MAG: glutathione S-transferase family protein [Pseudomonadales bacterium]